MIVPKRHGENTDEMAFVLLIKYWLHFYQKENPVVGILRSVREYKCSNKQSLDKYLNKYCPQKKKKKGKEKPTKFYEKKSFKQCNFITKRKKEGLC